MSDMEINPMNKWTDEKVSELAIMRFSDMPILQSMTHMFSFWKEVQETLFSGVEEIKRLTARIDELEKQQKV